MNIVILTLFPRVFSGPLEESLIGKARERGLLNVTVGDIRDHAEGRHRQADDSPYGGGAGMVMKVEPVAKAIESAKSRVPGAKVILMCPSGALLTQKKAVELSKLENLVIVCGHYEGFDERIRTLVDEEISIGDYVLTGGELPALVLVDAVARHVPGVVKEEDSVRNDSFYDGLLDFPSYTRPEEFEGMRVPEVLLSGNHKKVGEWRRREQIRRTFLRRPDLLKDRALDAAERKMLEEIILEQ